MKRLWVSVCIAILITSTLAVPAPQKAFAQGTQQAGSTSENTRSTLQVKAGTLFSGFISQLQAKQNDPRGQIPALRTASDADITKYIEQNKALLIAIYDGQATFNRLFTTPAAPSTNIYADFTAALNAAHSRINSLAVRLQIPSIVVETRSISSQIDALAQEKQSDLKNNGKEDEAGDIQKAVGTQRKEQVKKELSAGKCTSLFNSSIIDCIDAGFTWLIKNTILQIAGFLVWLSANMLNYAIQVSILDFSKWAPSSLYPIWMVIRQIVSLFVVFAGLWLGFMYIIGDETKFGKYVGWLVIFALFVNFSYPFSRALIDVSNIISLNVYTAAVGPGPLTGSETSSGGSLIMNKLGLQGLVGSATTAEGGTGFIKGINSTPGALIAVVFVLYAAYIFFRATAIIAIRTAILVFLTIASPLLLVDSVIPKLGEAAVKMRKMFFEQLAVAPVFMIMLALTLKFMDVFAIAFNGGNAETVGSGSQSIQMFFNILMMLIMLRIMLKVTESLAGEAGKFATNTLGKVGGFGLGVATGGAGLLARGTIGAAAARARDSGWMDKMQGSRTGRGLYTLTNSLSQSTFDARNVGVINKGAKAAGLTGFAGMGMGAGSSQTYAKSFAEKESAFNKKYSSMNNDEARATYYNQTKNGVGSRFQRAIMGKSDGDKLAEGAKKIEKDKLDKREGSLVAYEKADEKTRQKMYEDSASDRTLQKKMSGVQDYLNTQGGDKDDDILKTEQGRQQFLHEKTEALMKLDDSTLAKSLVENDTFKNIQARHDAEIKDLEAGLDIMGRGTEEEKKKYDDARIAINKKKQDHTKMVSQLKKDLLEVYNYKVSGRDPKSTDAYRENTRPVDIELDVEQPEVAQQPKPVHPGGSDFSHLDQNGHPVPAANGGSASVPGTDASASAKPRFMMDATEIRRDNERIKREQEQLARIQGGEGIPFDPYKIETNPDGTYTLNGKNYSSFPEAAAAKRTAKQAQNSARGGGTALSDNSAPMSPSPKPAPAQASAPSTPVIPTQAQAPATSQPVEPVTA